MKIKRWLIGIFCIILAEAILILILSAILPAKIVIGESRGPVLHSATVQQPDPTDGHNLNDQSGLWGEQDASDLPEKNKTTAARPKNRKARKIYNKNSENLVLVNLEHRLDASYHASLKPICNGRLYASERLCESLTQMLSDAQAHGYRYWIASAYRSAEKQQRLVDEDVQTGMRQGLSYDEALRQTYQETMPAGHSEHETGLALDILCSDNTNMDISQAQMPANIWLQENSWRYGFILRYPEEKESITGISYEPWHFRYVGKRPAAYMAKHHLTLEEFWDRLD